MLDNTMVRRRQRVDLRDFLSAEVPLTFLSPDLRQRVRHALAGHASLSSVTGAVVRELLEKGLLRPAGTVRDGAESVPVYTMSHSARAYDLRALFEMVREAEDQQTNEVENVGPVAPRKAPVEVPRDEGPSPRPVLTQGRAGNGSLSALDAIRRTLERDWVSFGLEASLETLLEQVAQRLEDGDLVLLLWSEEGGLRSGEGRGWMLLHPDDAEIPEFRRQLDHGSVAPGVRDHRRWFAVRSAEAIVGALGLSAELEPRLGQSAARTIEELLMAFRRSQERVHTDTLTGLHNRGFFESQLSIELERSSRLSLPLALLFADLDHFKTINDTYGHDSGDLVLQHVARLMVHHLRRIDQVFRWGGEEFALLLPGTAAGEALHTAERLRAVIEQTPVRLHDGRDLSCTISIGLAMAPDHALGGERALLRHADQALYRAKEGGRNRVVVFEN